MEFKFTQRNVSYTSYLIVLRLMSPETATIPETNLIEISNYFRGDDKLALVQIVSK